MIINVANAIFQQAWEFININFTLVDFWSTVLLVMNNKYNVKIHKN